MVQVLFQGQIVLEGAMQIRKGALQVCSEDPLARQIVGLAGLVEGNQATNYP